MGPLYELFHQRKLFQNWERCPAREAEAKRKLRRERLCIKSRLLTCGIGLESRLVQFGSYRFGEIISYDSIPRENSTNSTTTHVRREAIVIHFFSPSRYY